MSKLSFWDKLAVFFTVSKSSYLFIVMIALLFVIGIILYTSKKKTAKRNKTVYIVCSVFMLLFLLFSYHKLLGKIFDYMMNNLFITIYFPNLAIYLGAMIIMNIIVWVSIFHYKTSDLIRKVNVVVYVIMNYILALILSVINTEKLDVFTQSSVYQNNKAAALIELSSVIFVVWIIFLILYKIILMYLRKDYLPKKVVVRKKKLPSNYEPTTTPIFVHTDSSKEKQEQVINPIPELVLTPVKEEIKEKKENTKPYEDMLTVDDYKLLLKMLKEQKEKDKTDAALREQLQIEQLKRKELEKEQEKYTELEMLYRSVR